ncbi:ABC transporter ATP-binding protein [Undibacterium oligocarboniphilum]|uniref:ATP-binding cassette domain-containing protein n=1 Tax=Undibacterium oligocarboniphilum TaxID=666702 RepID=A0A850QJ02_9BURK|nr:ATP-binding cassette domain-containing protein [Undibacterium oligocarboniphilum]MBC3871272.1 ATP-binding cassette domain-containing protein [Undibacterium oligocarboniphilum]NVO79248.1 ATP-binding cassette domain-containing protein [Undibacterium oligocarboniphilum]
MQFDFRIYKTFRSAQRQFVLDIQWQSDSQRLVILGESGAGKSLTLQAMAGLIRPDQGHIQIGGRTLFDAATEINLAPQMRHLAYVFQDYALFPHLNVRQNIEFGLRRGWRNPDRKNSDPQVGYWLDLFSLHAVAHQFPHELSGGQKQRTALARALISKPAALLLDEPFAALDPVLRIAMRCELDALQQSLQVPMVLITHDQRDADVFGEEVLQLRHGQLLRQAQHWP